MDNVGRVGRLRLALIAPLRLALSAVWLVAARADGAPSGATLIALAAGAYASAFLVTNDRFARFRKAPDKRRPRRACTRATLSRG